MNSQSSITRPPLRKLEGRRLGLVLLAVALAIGATIRAVVHREDRQRARLERRQATAARLDVLRRLAEEPTAPGPIRGIPTNAPAGERPESVAGGAAGPLAAGSEVGGDPRPEVTSAALGSPQVAGNPARATGAEPRVGDGKARKNRGEDVFDDCVVPKLTIEVPRAGVAALRSNARKYVAVTVTEGDHVYTNVALKLKGGPGSFREFDDTPSMTLNFEKLAEGQSFHGLKKLHLNSSIQDRTYLCEKISRELFNAAGVPTPRAGHALVILNGREMGLHVVLEGVNRQFLKRHFADPGGNVYDGHAGMDVGGKIPVNEGENPADRRALKALAEAVREPDLETRMKRLESTLDVDRFLTFVAMESILAHWDGYTMNRNNYRIFHDRSTDRMVFLPHGMDQVLGRRDVALVPQSPAMVARAVLEVPEFRERYQARLREMATNVFRPAAITGRVREIVARVGPVLAREKAEEGTAFRRRSASFERRVVERSAVIERQLFGRSLAAARGTNATGRLEWEPRLDLGDAQLERVKDERGRSLLQVATEAGCTASWRSHAVLEPGRYRMEGEIRTKGVQLDDADTRSGAGFRVSRHRTGQKNSGDRDWQPVRFEFEVGEQGAEVELICELRAKKGVVWFDEGSIKLTRL